MGLSIVLSVITIAITAIINLRIAEVYLKASGKTQALFSMIEGLRFSYQYYVVGIGILAFIMAVIGKSEKTYKKYFALFASLVAITIVFLRVWRIFI